MKAKAEELKREDREAFQKTHKRDRELGNFNDSFVQRLADRPRLTDEQKKTQLNCITNLRALRARLVPV